MEEKKAKEYEYEVNFSSDDDNTSSSGSSSEEYDDPPSQQQMRLSLPNTAINADRFGVSDRAAAAIATGVLQDMGLVSEEHREMVIDKAKVRRERAKMRRNIAENEEEDGLMKEKTTLGRRRLLMETSVWI